MVRQGVAGAVIVPPESGNSPVDIRQDLIRGLCRPGGVRSARGMGSRGSPGHRRIVAQACGGYLHKTGVNIPVDQLVAVQPDSFVQEGFRIPAHLDHLLLFHGGEGHIFREIEGAGHLFGHIRLDDRNIIGRLKEEVVVIPAGGSVGYIHGSDGFQQSAAGNDRHIPRPVRTGKRLQDFIIHLLQFFHEEGIGIVHRQAAGIDPESMIHDKTPFN